MKLIMQSSPAPCHYLPLRSKYSPQHHVLKHPQSGERPTFTPTQKKKNQVKLWKFLEREHEDK